MAVRTVVKIDEDLCDGCGLCVPGCAEGALQIIDGKAKLVSDIYCDGLGACLGECPQGAISMIEREAGDFDEEAMKKHLDSLTGSAEEVEKPGHGHHHGHGHQQDSEPSLCGCPGSMSQSFDKPKPSPAPATSEDAEAGPVASRLGNWPVQIMLAPVNAPYFDGARLVIAADCAPFAYADFHRRFLEGKTLLIGCPKLDDTDIYLEKLTEIFKQNNIASVDVVYMEVPCCSGLTQLAQVALERSGKQIPATLNRVGIKGDFVEERVLGGVAA